MADLKSTQEALLDSIVQVLESDNQSSTDSKFRAENTLKMAEALNYLKPGSK